MREVNAQQPRADFENLIFKDGEHVDDFAIRITDLTTRLCLLGDTIDDTRIIQKFLRIAPSLFTQVVISIKTLRDLRTLSIGELTGQLRLVEDRLDDGLDDGLESSGGGWLLLMKKEWEAKKRKVHGGGASSSGNNPGRGGGHTQSSGGNYRWKPGRSQQQDGLARDSGNNDDRNKCHYCGKPGLWTRECHKRLADEAAVASVNLFQAEEDGGPAMMLAYVETM